MIDGYAEEPDDNANVINFNEAKDKVSLANKYFDESIDDDYHYMDYEYIKMLEEEERYINNILLGSNKPIERAIKRIENGQAILMFMFFLQAIISIAIWLTNI
tara:strand:- start:2624 stop:2932 length:309 start_codon:yes stop_codon:yes gene_type:complete